VVYPPLQGVPFAFRTNQNAPELAGGRGAKGLLADVFNCHKLAVDDDP
jgi:hypothetical protein